MKINPNQKIDDNKMQSRLLEKIRLKMPHTDEDWNQHLIETHAVKPHLTPNVFASPKTKGGFSSYELLADLFFNKTKSKACEISVLDLGCGDGHLVELLLPRLNSTTQVVGVDLAEKPLLWAAQKGLDPRVRYLAADAKKLPLESDSIDFVLCHLSLMLMSPLDAVITEVQRVLKPDGVLAGVIPGGPARGVHKKIQRLAGLFVQAHLPGYLESRSHGLNSAHLQSWGAEIQDFELEFHVSPEGLWDYLMSMYFVGLMPDSAKREFKDEIFALAYEHRDQEAKVRFLVPMKLFSCSFSN